MALSLKAILLVVSAILVVFHAANVESAPGDPTGFEISERIVRKIQEGISEADNALTKVTEGKVGQGKAENYGNNGGMNGGNNGGNYGNSGGMNGGNNGGNYGNNGGNYGNNGGNYGNNNKPSGNYGNNGGNYGGKPAGNYGNNGGKPSGNYGGNDGKPSGNYGGNGGNGGNDGKPSGNYGGNGGNGGNYDNNNGGNYGPADVTYSPYEPPYSENGQSGVMTTTHRPPPTTVGFGAVASSFWDMILSFIRAAMGIQRRQPPRIARAFLAAAAGKDQCMKTSACHAGRMMRALLLKDEKKKDEKEVYFVAAEMLSPDGWKPFVRGVRRSALEDEDCSKFTCDA